MLILTIRFCFAVIIVAFINFFYGVLSINEGLPYKRYGFKGNGIKKRHYTIVAPATIRPDSNFHVSITLNDFNESCWFQISLTTFMRHEKIYEFESVEVKPGTTKLIKLHAPSLDNGLANLEVHGYRGIISKDSALIQIRSEENWAIIQTNKLKYKPGELVQYRLICIDQLTRPSKLNQNITIQIFDGQHNTLKSLSDIELVQGVYKGEFQISNNPVMGIWKIRATSDIIFTEKNFEVDRYVLPKFNVNIKASIIATEKDQVQLEVSASYFHGEPVKGNLTIIFTNTELPSLHYYMPYVPTLTRDLEFNGKITIILDLKNDLKLELGQNKDQGPLNPYSLALGSYKFSVEASVIDELSEEKSWAETDLEIHSEPYYIDLESPDEFESDEIIKIKVKVVLKDITGNWVKNTKTPIDIIVGCGEVIGYNRNLLKFDQVQDEYKSKDKEEFVTVNVTNKNYNECYVYAVYEGIKSKTERMYKKNKDFEMKVLTESPVEGKELEIKITNPDPIEEFSYEIAARGDIILSEHVFVPENQTTYILCFNVTSLMVPRITIYTHNIKDMKFRGRLQDVVIKRAHPNSIEITTDNEAKPGSLVTVNVTTDEGSYVGLMALDRSALQNVNQKEIIDKDYVNNVLKMVNSEQSYPVPLYGATGDVITFSNVLSPDTQNGAVGELPILKMPEGTTKLLPESWLFKDFQRTPAGGFTFNETTPDTVTTWAITGFSIHPDTGLTFTKNTTNLEVVQQLSVSFDLPSFMREGEIIEIPIFITNYMNQEALINVTIESDSEDLEILEHPKDISTPQKNISKLVPGKKRDELRYFLKPLKSGLYNISVKAISPSESDTTLKTLNVIPRGISYTRSKSYLVHLLEENIQEDEITIDIPENSLPGSQIVKVSVVGDIFGHLIENLQKLSQGLYMNAEDNMKLIVANSIVLKYLKTLNYSNPNLENKIRHNLELGYQNQLTFKYSDGSFGLFERKIEKTGDIWQTAFALWGLKKANEFIHIDPRVISGALNYLSKQQQTNGCYKSNSGLEEDVKSTALVLTVFLMDETLKTNYNEAISKGLECLYKSSKNLEHSPCSDMAAYVLLLGNHEKADNLTKKLTSGTHFLKKQMTWTSTGTIESYLEITAGSFMNLIESQEISDQNSLRILRGLIDSKNEDSPIYHMIALQAMIGYFEKSSLLKTNLKIRFKDDHHNSGDFRIDSENSQLIQRYELASNSRKVKLQSKGHGFAMVEVQYKYNVVVPENETSSHYSIDISTQKHSNIISDLVICSSVLSNEQQSKFTVMEINLQTGYIFSHDDMNDIEQFTENIKSLQFNEARNEALVYFDYNSNHETCIELEVRKTYQVLNSKPGWVIVYGANNKDQKAAKSFLLYDF